VVVVLIADPVPWFTICHLDKNSTACAYFSDYLERGMAGLVTDKWIISPYISSGSLSSLESSVQQYCTSKLIWGLLHRTAEQELRAQSNPSPVFVLKVLRKLVERDCSQTLSQISKQCSGIQMRVQSDRDVVSHLPCWQCALTESLAQLSINEECFQRLDSAIETVTEEQRFFWFEDKGFRDVSIGKGSSPFMAASAAVRDTVNTTINLINTRMSIIESERQSKEAALVARLTELAFFFIPLSFSASLFGMQVKVSQIHFVPSFS
jgi:hypothetical protein